MKKPVDELTRLRRIILTLALIIFVFFIGVITWGSVEVARIKNAVTTVANQQPKVINGVSGRDGLSAYTPVKGKDYFDGKDGRNGRDSISTNTILEKTTTILKDTIIPEKGEKGDPGETPQLMVNTSDCTLRTKLPSEESWKIQAQLPKPCEIQ